MKRFRKKPVVITAMQFVDDESAARLFEWGAGKILPTGNIMETLLVQTLEGSLTARRGDWIVRGIQGEFYPVKDEIFQATYESDESCAGAVRG